MKLPSCHFGNRPSPHREHGMITILFIALLAIMMILLTVEASSIMRLRNEIRLVEQQQAHRVALPATNAIPTVLHHE